MLRPVAPLCALPCFAFHCTTAFARENAEAIAFYGGDAHEAADLRQRLAAMLVVLLRRISWLGCYELWVRRLAVLERLCVCACVRVRVRVHVCVYDSCIHLAGLILDLGEAAVVTHVTVGCTRVVGTHIMCCLFCGCSHACWLSIWQSLATSM
jgi:hypothetical protein